MAYTTSNDFTLTNAGSYTTSNDFNLSIGGGGGSSEDIFVQLTSGSLSFVGQELSIGAEGTIQVVLGEGYLNFSGSELAVITQTLKGADAHSVTIQGTVELNYLSDDLHTFEVDYYPYHENYIPVPLINSALTVFGEVNVENFSLLGGGFDSSYLYDFYFRIHIEPLNIDLGVIVSAQTYTVNIWNAWFNNVSLSSVSPVDLPDTNFNFPYATPYTFKPLENVEVSINIAEFGVPTIDGRFDLTFDDIYGLYSLGVQGQRAVLWPYCPLVDFTEVRSWLTDVIPSKVSEQRFVTRQYPRLNLNYKYSFRNTADFSSARAYAAKINQYALAMPYWYDGTRVYNLTSGTDVIYLDTTYLELEVDMLITLFVSYKQTEMKRIATVLSDRITLSSVLENSYTECILIPTYIGWSEGINFNEDENYTKTCNIAFASDKAYSDSTYYTPEATYKSLPILTDPSVVTGGLSGTYSREQEVFDSIVGGFTKVDIDFYNRLKFAVRMNTVTKAEAFVLRRKLDYFKGKYVAFWLPSYNDDLIPTTDITVGVQTFKVETNAWDRAVPTYIRVHGSSTAEFEIDTVTDNLDGTMTIAIVEVPAASITNITRIETMTKVRFNTDNFEYNHPDRYLTTIAAPVIEVSE